MAAGKASLRSQSSWDEGLERHGGKKRTLNSLVLADLVQAPLPHFAHFGQGLGFPYVVLAGLNPGWL